MRQEYDKAIASIQQDIEVFYQRFAKNNEVSFADARQLLNAGQLKEFKWTVEEYIQKGRENAVDQRHMKELENASIKVRVSRLEALQLQMRQEVELLAAKHQQGTSELLHGIYKDNYYRSVFELQKGTGVGSSFAKLDNRQINNLLVTPWAPDGRDFSSRIWGDRSKLISELQTTLVQGLIRGNSSDTMINIMTERMGVSRRDAERLVLTEIAFFSGHSRREAYKELEVEEFKNVATLDKKTSTLCRQMDGTVFKVAEAQPNVNCAPFHARCRTVDIPHFEGNVKERAARNEKGDHYMVPGDMTYKEWAKKNVSSDLSEPSGSSNSSTQADPSPATKEPPASEHSGSVEEPSGLPNRRFNPKASYHIELPQVGEETLERLTETNRSIAKEGHKRAKEIAVLLSSKEGIPLARTSGTINKAEFSNEMDAILREASSNSIILTHNHPQGTRINLKDIQNLSLYPSLQAIVAVGHDGGVSAVSTLGKFINVWVFNDLMAKTAEKVNKQLSADSNYAIMSSSERRYYFSHLVLLSMVEELGWEYVEDFEAARTPNWGI
ncbi:minor capsid protein [Paenibacillus sp. YYML68]|uniref:minor capsid protein n=1 Tax=Paenibacillus sp. YYML68 TaxID=2909250 RepID=UPI00248F7A98|nr:minor capsid protein [Paenibacillus sp. YYML68]